MSHKKRFARGPGRALILTLAAIVSLSLAGCTGSGTSGNESPGASSTDPLGVDDGTQLTMWTRAPLERQANALVNAYNSGHQNQISLEIIPNDDMEGKVGAAATNDELPDLMAGDVVRLPYWVDNGMFTDITDRIESLSFRSDIARGHIDAGTADGKEHTLPFVTDISVMVWNKDLYTQAGLDPDKGPTTLQEFVDQAKAVAALGQSDVAGTYFGGNCGGCLVFTWFPYIWGNGDEVLSADGKTSLLNGDSAKEVYAAYKDLNDSGAVGAGSREETGATWTAPFSDGKIGVMPYPNTSVYAASEAGINVGVGPIPGVNGGEATFLGGDAMGISKDSKSVDQAWNFLAWMMSDDTQLNVIAKNGEVPSRTSLLSNTYTNANPLAATMNATVAYGRTPVATYFAEAFNASGSPWTVLFRNAVFQGTNTLDADNQAITDVLDQ